MAEELQGVLQAGAVSEVQELLPGLRRRHSEGEELELLGPYERSSSQVEYFLLGLLPGGGLHRPSLLLPAQGGFQPKLHQDIPAVDHSSDCLSHHHRLLLCGAHVSAVSDGVYPAVHTFLWTWGACD